MSSDPENGKKPRWVISTSNRMNAFFGVIWGMSLALQIPLLVEKVAAEEVPVLTLVSIGFFVLAVGLCLASISWVRATKQD